MQNNFMVTSIIGTAVGSVGEALHLEGISKEDEKGLKGYFI